MPKKRSISFILWSLAGLLIFSFTYHRRTPSNGSQSPVFCNFNQEGEEICFPKDSVFQGKMILLEFTASWCSKCLQQKSSIEKTVSYYGNRSFEDGEGLSFVTISLDKDSTKWLNSLENYNVRGTHFIDTGMWYGPLIQSYGISYLPYTFLIDAKGKIVSQGLFGSALQAKLESLRKK